MTSQTENNILRSRCNQTKKTGKLIEYDIGNIFVKNHKENVVIKNQI